MEKISKKLFNNKSILITGGTGSFGQSFLEYLLTNFKSFRKIIIFSRDEFKQHEMSIRFPVTKYPFLRYFLGDVRDRPRVERILEGVDFIVHAAALKQVPSAEDNPFEAIKTNVIGAQNIVEAALNAKVKKVITLSTDKAVVPLNLYGATKLCSDKLFLAANNIKGSRDLIFSVVRYGNVMGSRGSVIPKFLRQKKEGLITVTHKKMTRFNILMEKCVQSVAWALQNCVGGEIIIPKAPSYNLLDLIKAIAPNCKTKYIGVRTGEKLHEELIAKSDSYNTYDLGDKYVILENRNAIQNNFYVKNEKAKKVKENFSYDSYTNPKFLNVNELRTIIKEYTSCA